MKKLLLFVTLTLSLVSQAVHAENVRDDVQLFNSGAEFNNFIAIDQKNHKVSGFIQLKANHGVHFEKGSDTSVQAEGTYHVYTVKGANGEVLNRKLVLELEDINNTSILFRFAKLEMDITHVNFENNNWEREGVSVTFSSWIDNTQFPDKAVKLQKMDAALPE